MVATFVTCPLNALAFVAPHLACGETRGRECIRSDTRPTEQRSHRPNGAQPCGRRVFSGQTSLLAPYRSTARSARRSRLVWPKNPSPQKPKDLVDRSLGFNKKLNPTCLRLVCLVLAFTTFL